MGKINGRQRIIGTASQRHKIRQSQTKPHKISHHSYAFLPPRLLQCVIAPPSPANLTSITVQGCVSSLHKLLPASGSYGKKKSLIALITARPFTCYAAEAKNVPSKLQPLSLAAEKADDDCPVSQKPHWRATLDCVSYRLSSVIDVLKGTWNQMRHTFMLSTNQYLQTF